ncbi:MAG TPA: hypothetical protein VKE27_10950 [Candidatus Dormibacteraeota bacterium]|nr:hypothetical protein [Candidatus Dormibacteraeota bacterium]
MAALDPHAWHDFFSVAGTAAAALLGLVLVAISLRIEVVESHPVLRNRARSAILVLGGLLLISLIALIPEITALWFGLATLVLELGRIGMTGWGLVEAARSSPSGLPRSVWLRTTPNLLTLLSVGGAVSLLAGAGPGIYLIAAAFVLTMGPMLFSVWGLLFAPEVRRSSRS